MIFDLISRILWAVILFGLLILLMQKAQHLVG
jgi:hypothetical protein